MLSTPEILVMHVCCGYLETAESFSDVLLSNDNSRETTKYQKITQIKHLQSCMIYLIVNNGYV